MKALGFNSVKFWVQWRWSHREEGGFYFGDLDELMDIAHRNNLRVTLNTIFDVSPEWLYEKYPEAFQITSSGHPVTPEVSGCRQIGGTPGPCYNHPGARRERQMFMEAAVEHFKDHPALAMWDVWNEPEQCIVYRNPELPNLVCYCPNCREGFLHWLKEKYISLDKLNSVWGRCYQQWHRVELPHTSATFTDFIDFREFQLDTMTSEAKWRLKLVKKLDGSHPAYLHVVPNTYRIFNSLTCVDDFALAEECDVFASTMFSPPIWSIKTVSAGYGKMCFNAECHIGGGSTRIHQKWIEENDLIRDLLPQIGIGSKGFLFWQFRPEVLGIEAPAWGVVKPDGSDSSFSRGIRTIKEKLEPYMEDIMEAASPAPAIGIWSSRKNEIFNFCVYSEQDQFAESIEAYVNTLYWNNYPCRIVNENMLEEGRLEGIKLLIMPICYYLTEKEAQSLHRWVCEGGMLLCEAHLAGYNADSGMHSRVVPGNGLSRLWKIREKDTTSTHHLVLEDQKKENMKDLSDDVRKMLETYGMSGGKYVPIELDNGRIIAGADRFAILEAEGATVLGTFHGNPCMVIQEVEKGRVIYCGTNIGVGSLHDPSGFTDFLLWVCQAADINPTLECVQQDTGSVHLDILESSNRTMLVFHNKTKEDKTIQLNINGEFKGVFTGITLVGEGRVELKVKGGTTDILISAKS